MEMRTSVAATATAQTRSGKPGVRPVPAWAYMSLVALVLRLGMMLWLQGYDFQTGHNHFAFGMETGSIAGSIARGEGFSSPFGVPTGSTAWISPIFPYLLAGIFKIFGLYSTASAIVILSINCLFSSLTCIPLYFLGKQTVGERLARWAGWIWAVFPYFMIWPAIWVWDTSLSALLMTSLVLYTLWLGRSSRVRDWVGYGVAWGFAALANPALLGALPVCGIWAAWKRFRTKTRWLMPVVISAVTFWLVLSPWLIRNRVVFGEWVFLRSNFGFEFSLGNYHLSNGLGWGGHHPSRNALVMERYRNLGEIEFVRQTTAEAKQFVRDYPGEFLGLTWYRFRSFWDGEMLAYMRPDDRGYWPAWLYAMFSILALFGVWQAWRKKMPGIGVLAGTIILYPLPYYLAYPMPRYRYAIEPIMLLLCAVAACGMAERCGGAKSATNFSKRK